MIENDLPPLLLR